ncbi:MAG: DUF4383 domain-containing protein [bacterium]|nr:DUF4383 domain-containing protein [bacterium]
MAETFTIIFGIILMLLGLLGFVNNSLIGANALFAADTVHNVIHLLLGGVLLVAAFWASEKATFWLKIIGAVTFLLGLIGLLTAPSTGGLLLGIAYSNGASDWFHLVFGAVIFVAGMYSNGTGMPPVSSMLSNPQREM